MMKSILRAENQRLWSSRPKRTRVFLFLAVLVGLLAACDLPVSPQSDQGRVATGVAQTVAALGVEPDQGEEKAPPSEPPGPTDTAAPPPTDTLPPTASHTPTPDVLGVHVSNDTFCRLGTGSDYEALGILNPNQRSEILAVDPSGDFWYIANPDAEGQCWIWGRYATPDGPTDQLPVYTPPPRPVYNFTFYTSDCAAGTCFLWFRIKNTGPLPLRSVRLTVETESTWGTGTLEPISATVEYNGFMSGSLPVDPDLSQIAVGSGGFIHSGGLRNPLGNPATAQIRICSQNNLGGVCTTQVINFTPD
jgi:hypothetical protein